MRLVANCDSDLEYVLVIAGGEVEIEFAPFFGRVGSPHLPFRPFDIGDIESTSVVGHGAKGFGAEGFGAKGFFE